MSLLQDILQWSATLKPWQSDALRRLILQGDLTSQDYDDLFALLKSTYGLSDPLGRTPQPLTANHLPSTSTTGKALTLLTMREMKDVNRIATNQTMKFSPTGLTVIYGDNASGKSGYSRVLKRACRARDQEEKVLPNAFLPASKQGVPEALFDVEVSGTVKTLKWTNNQPPPAELSSISVFDTRCARAYVDQEQDVAYMPYGLDVVETLGQTVLPELDHRLKDELAGCAVDLTAFEDLHGPTSVGQIISTLSAKTNMQVVRDLANFTPAESQRRTDLDKMLSENDPKGKARVLRLVAQRFTGVLNRINLAVALVDDSASGQFKALDDATLLATAAEQRAVTAFQSGESLLPGTGGPEWRLLFDAARRFSSVSYPGKAFPVVDPASLCPLCQQTLSDGAGRLQRFEEFIKKDTARTAAEKRKAHNATRNALAEKVIDFRLDATLLEELSQYDGGLETSLREFESLLARRKKWILNAMETHDWSNPPAIVADPRVALTQGISASNNQAAAFEKAADDALRHKMQLEITELNARVALAKRKQSVLDAIGKLERQSVLQACQEDLKTRPISDKSKDLTDRVVTQALQTALNRELDALGIKHLKMMLVGHTESGKTYHKLTLDLPKGTRLESVLSEGEHRAIAIASFLAELSLSGHTGGIVFDDPVSSLDHFRRASVAQRLVQEAKTRQVIVLTHDTIFLGELHDRIEREQLPNTMNHLTWVGDRAGQCVEGLPWDHQPYRDRIDKLEKHQKRLEKNWSPYPNESQTEEMRCAYSRFRATLERVIQDVVFNGVIQRYRDWIRVDNLKGAVGFTELEFQEIDRLHKIACGVTEAHDRSSAKNSPVPGPDQLAKDIASLKTLIEDIKKRRKTVVSQAQVV